MNSPGNQAKSLAVYTLGCRSNQYQSSLLEREMGDQRSEIRRFGEEADTYIINTCIVTLDAERKSRQAIRRALRFGKKVIVSGCLARLEGAKLKELYPTIEIRHFDPSSSLPLPQIPLIPQVRANLMIEDGCENYCSYCIVPYARGKVQCKPIVDILREAQSLVDAGAREIVLTGINLGAYGENVGTAFMAVRNKRTGTSPVPTLSNVLQELSKIDNLYRLRLSSLEPQYVTKELIDTIAQDPKICQYLHIPLQSGDDKVLKAMNRKYSVEEYADLIERIRRKIPDCGISTDVIVGFPGETDEQFLNTIRTIEKIGFSRLHIFPYSARDLTAAAKLPNQIDPKVKKQRFKVLDKIGKEQMRSFAKKYLGKEVEILVEQKGEGLTSNYIRVKFDDPKDLSGHLHRLTLNDSHLAPA